MPDTCRLYWSTNYVLNNWDTGSSSIQVPTNFPTKRLLLVVSDDDIPRLSLILPYGNTFDTDKVVDITIVRENTSTTTGYTNRDTRVMFGSTSIGVYQNNGMNRMTHLEYDSASTCWISEVRQLSHRVYFPYRTRENTPIGWHETIADWLALHPELATP